MKIVRFKDGSYALRKLSIFGYVYCDRKSKYWWGIDFIHHAKLDSLNEAKALIEIINDYGTPVKDL